MVDSQKLTVALDSADFEKGDVEKEDAEEGETIETVEDGMEKGRRCTTDEPDLIQPLLSTEDAQREELAAAPKQLILAEKILVSILVVCFVLVEAYFVGRSFRTDNNEHLHQTNSSSLNQKLQVFVPMSVPQDVPPFHAVDAVKESVVTGEHLEIVLDGSSDSGVLSALKKLSPTSPSGLRSVPLMEQNASFLRGRRWRTK